MESLQGVLAIDIIKVDVDVDVDVPLPYHHTTSSFISVKFLLPALACFGRNSRWWRVRQESGL